MSQLYSAPTPKRLEIAPPVLKMSVSSLTGLHTPCQTLGFSPVSKEQPLFKSVTRLNPVFQPIVTVTIVTVNIARNTGFSPVTDLNKGCSLLAMLKPNVCQGVCSSVRLDTNIFIGTSVLNCQTLKALFLQILVNKIIFLRKLGGIHFFSSTCGQNMRIYIQILLPTVSLGSNLLVKAQTIPQNAKCVLFFFFLPKVVFTKDI